MNSSRSTAFDSVLSGTLADTRRGQHTALIDPQLVRILAAALEFIALASVGCVIAALYLNGEPSAPRFAYLAAILGAAALTVFVGDTLGLYAPANLRTPMHAVPRQIAVWSLILLVLALTLFLCKAGPEFSRVWFATWFAVGAAGLIAMRMSTAHLLAYWTRCGRITQRAVIYGTGEATRELIARLEANPDCDLTIVGIFDDRAAKRVDSPDIASYPLIGSFSDLINTVRTTRVDTIIVALPVTAEVRLSGIFEQLSVLPADIRLPALTSRLRFQRSAYTLVGGVAMFAVYDKPISCWGMLMKSLFDKAVATLALVVLSPLFALVAAAVKLDSAGPVFFRQKRYGFNNELIEVYKFRSMKTGKLDANAAKLVTKDDPRVTRVGRFIRKSSLDELPQLINVLRGELSLVGPRPHALQAKAADRLYADVAERYFARHKVKPGITGWAQINGWRGETDTEEKLHKRVEHDLYYIENWSLLLDLYILLRTPLALFKTENAY